MEKINGLLELLSTLILSTGGRTIKISKDTLRDIQTSLQHAQENIAFLQPKSQLQQEELQQWSNHFKPISV